MKQRWLIAICGIGLLIAQAGQAAVYVQNFDSLAVGTDMFTVPGWSGGYWGSASQRHVSDLQSVSSPRSLYINGPPVGGADPMVMVTPSDPAILGQSINSGKWQITFDYRPTALGGWTELPLQSSLSRWAVLQEGTPFNLQTLSGIAAGQWNQIEMDLDFGARNISLSANGGLPTTKAMIAGNLARFGFQATTENPGEIYIDNLSISSTPPPPPPTLPQVARRLLLDARNVDQIDNAVLRVGTVQKSPANPLFGEEHPWEARFDNLYPTVLFDAQEQIYKAWYFTFTVDVLGANGQPVPQAQRIPGTYKNYSKSTRKTGLGYATSTDGIHWTKPLMDKVLWEGELSNLLMENMEGAGVIKDMHETDPSRRYKMFGKLNTAPFSNSLAVAFSADGINWSTPTYAPEAHAAADTHNNAVWVPELNKYVGITRLWSEAPIQRIVGRTESTDFVHWTEATEVLRGDLQHQTYSMRVFTHAGVFLGLTTILTLDNTQPATFDHMTTELSWSLDGIEWQRIDPGRPLIGNSSQAGTYDWGAVNSALPIFQDDQILIYYGASDGTHGDWRNGFLALATLRPDGFAGYEPLNPAEPAMVTTETFNLSANGLKITADAQGGSVTAVLLDQTGNILFTSAPVTGNVTDYSLSWVGGATLENLIGQDVQLQFEINRARLYSYFMTAIVPGDYNGDGTVDAADYVMWRDDPASFGPNGYDTWRTNFGRSAGSGSGSATGTLSQAAVPEPSAWAITLSVLCCWHWRGIGAKGRSS